MLIQIKNILYSRLLMFKTNIRYRFFVVYLGKFLTRYLKILGAETTCYSCVLGKILSRKQLGDLERIEENKLYF